MIKNYIFDFGNVLAEFYPERMTARYITGEKEIKRVAAIVFDRLYWDRLDEGIITDEEVKAGIRSRLPEELCDDACKVYDNWVSSMVPVKGMYEVICSIKNKGGKLYLLSNISKGFAENYKNIEWINELLSKFDGLVMSGEIGIVKPHREIFEYILDRFNLKAEECIFIDDREENILGGETVGIKGYLFDGDAEKLKKHFE